MMIEKYLKSFKKNIIALRNELELTQKDVAEKLHISYQAYQAYESGVNVPSFQSFLMLCEVFDVTPNTLLDYD